MKFQLFFLNNQFLQLIFKSENIRIKLCSTYIYLNKLVQQFRGKTSHVNATVLEPWNRGHVTSAYFSTVKVRNVISLIIIGDSHHLYSHQLNLSFDQWSYLATVGPPWMVHGELTIAKYNQSIFKLFYKLSTFFWEVMDFTQFYSSHLGH